METRRTQSLRFRSTFTDGGKSTEIHAVFNLPGFFQFFFLRNKYNQSQSGGNAIVIIRDVRLTLKCLTTGKPTVWWNYYDRRVRVGLGRGEQCARSSDVFTGSARAATGRGFRESRRFSVRRKVAPVLSSGHPASSPALLLPP